MVQQRPVRVERRLSAMLAADVAGYSRLMHNDEEATIAKIPKSDGLRCRARRPPPPKQRCQTERTLVEIHLPLTRLRLPRKGSSSPAEPEPFSAARSRNASLIQACRNSSQARLPPPEGP
jgi:hypothetical protein